MTGDERAVCLITGGASGIGAACVTSFAAAGYRVAFGDVQEGKGRAIAVGLGEAAFFSRLDVRSEADFAEAVAATLSRWGRLDCLVNNAAIGGVIGPVAEIPVDEYDHTCAVVQRSVFLGVREAARAMLPRRTGSIVNIASISGLTGGYGPHVYSACKAAVIALTKSLSKELVGKGDICVNSVSPAVIQTPILDQLSREQIDMMLSKIPLGRTGKPDEVAALVHFLSSADCSFTTGFCFDISGGRATY